jgi:serpin B
MYSILNILYIVMSAIFDYFKKKFNTDKVSKERTVSLTTNGHGDNYVNNFANHLYTINKDVKDSWIMSPLSVLFCIGMFYRGTDGGTEKEIKSLLKINKKDMCNNLIVLKDVLNKNLVKMTNVIYLSDRVKNNILPEFREDINKFGMFDTVDIYKPAQEISRINTFVEQHTNNLIKNLLPGGSITPDTLVILLNTIYFKSIWEIPFSKRSTKLNSQFNSIDKKKTVDMMTQYCKYFPYYEDKKYQILELSYKDSSCVFGIILPKKLTDKINITPNQLKTYWKKLHNTEITLLNIPKFRIEYNDELSGKLQSMGLRTMFQNASVNDMIDIKNTDIKRSICVDKVIHKAVIIVDEEGTEAAAATVTSMCEIQGMDYNFSPPINFIADHPFMFYIRETVTNCIIFQGQFN